MRALTLRCGVRWFATRKEFLPKSAVSGKNDNVELADVEERRSVLRARCGVMSHGASGGVFDITGTDIVADDAAFLLKEAYMDIRLDGSDTFS